MLLAIGIPVTVVKFHRNVTLEISVKIQSTTQNGIYISQATE